MQKHLFYLFLCCIFSNLSIGQNYTPFDFDNGLWEEEYYNMQHERSYYNYFTNGDTIINNLAYKKLYKRGRSTITFGYTGFPPIPWFGFSGYFGFIREDNNKRIYHLDPSNGGVEELLYDFNISLGDTIAIPTIAHSYDSAIVVAVDSVPICSSMRRRYRLDPVGTQLLDILYWIEGVGSSHGLIPRYNWFESGVIYTCYSDSTCITPCQTIIVSTTSIKKQYSKLATIYPNPSSETSIIQFNNGATKTSIQVLNNIGQIMFNKTTETQEEQLDLSSWPTGIYYIKLEYDQQIETHYLIKQ